jgi:hypothetical protein
MHVWHAHVFQIFGKQKVLFIKIPINILLPVAAGFAVATAADARWSFLPLTNDGLWRQE